MARSLNMLARTLKRRSPTQLIWYARLQPQEEEPQNKGSQSDGEERFLNNQRRQDAGHRDQRT